MMTNVTSCGQSIAHTAEVYALFRDDIKDEVPSGKGEGARAAVISSCSYLSSRVVTHTPMVLVGS